MSIDQSQLAKMSESEMQLLIQMLDGLGREQRAGFDRMDRKFETMVPRTEFDDLKARMRENFDAVYKDLDVSREDRRHIRESLSDSVEDRKTDMAAVRDEIITVATANNQAKIENLTAAKKLNLRIWGALGAAALTGVISVFAGLSVARLDGV